MTMLWICLLLPLPLAACPGLQTSLLQLTPRLALLEPQALALDVTGSLRLFGGPRALWQRVLHACPLGTRVGMAPSAWAAALLARHAQGPHRFLRLASMQRGLNRLPCEALSLTPTMTTQLQSWGCCTLGHLQRLPRAGLAQRGFNSVLEQLDRAYRPTQNPAAWLTPPLAFKASRELAFHGASLAAIETALVPLIADLCGYLQAYQVATNQIHLTLHHDPTRIADPETRITVSLSRPQWEAKACLYLCRLRIQALPLPGPVRRITLACPHCQPRQALSASLLPDARVDSQREERLFDVLQARLGATCLAYPQLLDWPLPEQAESWVPTARSSSRPSPAGQHQWPKGRPFWLLSPPTSLDTRHGHPVWQDRPLQLLPRPERIEGGWWRSSAMSRDYFVAQDIDSARYWVYRDLKSGGWFLHGLFA